MDYLSRLAELTGISPTQKAPPEPKQGAHFHTEDISQEDVILTDSSGIKRNELLSGETPEDSFNRNVSPSGANVPVEYEAAPITSENEVVIPEVSNANDFRENEKESLLPKPEDPVIQKEVQEIHEEPIILNAITPKTMEQEPKQFKGSNDRENISHQKPLTKVGQDKSVQPKPTLSEVRKWIAQEGDDEVIARFPARESENRLVEENPPRNYDQRQLRKAPFSQDIGIPPKTEKRSDYHLSIGSINLIVEAPERKPEFPQVKPTPKGPEHNDYRSRLSRHYIRAR